MEKIENIEMYLIKCVVKLAMFMNKIYQLGLPKFECLYENKQNFSPAQLYCRHVSLYTINLSVFAKFCVYRKKVCYSVYNFCL